MRNRWRRCPQHDASAIAWSQGMETALPKPVSSAFSHRRPHQTRPAHHRYSMRSDRIPPMLPLAPTIVPRPRRSSMKRRSCPVAWHPHLSAAMRRSTVRFPVHMRRLPRLPTRASTCPWRRHPFRERQNPMRAVRNRHALSLSLPCQHFSMCFQCCRSATLRTVSHKCSTNVPSTLNCSPRMVPVSCSTTSGTASAPHRHRRAPRHPSLKRQPKAYVPARTCPRPRRLARPCVPRMQPVCWAIPAVQPA